MKQGILWIFQFNSEVPYGLKPYGFFLFFARNYEYFKFLGELDACWPYQIEY